MRYNGSMFSQLFSFEDSLKIDFYLILSILLLLVFGIVVIWSTDPVLAQRQFYFGIAGFFLFFVFSIIDYRSINRVVPYLFGLVVVLLIVTLIWGQRIRGVGRWFQLGPVHFQPSELAKLVLILALSWFYCSKFFSTILKFGLSLAVVLFTAGLVAVQPDLGTSIILVFLWVFISFIANIPFLYFGALGLFAFFSLPVVWQFLAGYQRERIYAFLNPQSDPLGGGYSVLQAIIAVGSGMFLGRGLGRGPQSQLRFLPERTTDFIFASLAEEWGLLGAIVLLVLFFLLLFRVWRIAGEADTGFGSLLSTGVFAMILIQVVINVGMNIGLMPITGIPLPLISAGGSSLLTTLISLGLVHSVAIHSSG